MKWKLILLALLAASAWAGNTNSIIRLPDVRFRYQGDLLRDGRWHPVQTLARRTQPVLVTFTNIGDTAEGFTLVSFEEKKRVTNHGDTVDESVMRVSLGNQVFRLQGSFLVRSGSPEAQTAPSPTEGR